MLSFIGLIRLAISNLRINRLRSILTILGMVFGTGAVIATLSSSEGAARFIQSELEKLGTNTINIRLREPGIHFKQSDIEYLRKYIPEFNHLSLAIVGGQYAVRYREKIFESKALGIASDFFGATRLSLAQGRYFDKFEENNNSFVVVLGNSTKQALFGKQNPIGQFVHLYSGSTIFPLMVVGVLNERGGEAASVDSAFFVSWRTLRKLRPVESLTAYLMGTLRDDEKSSQVKATVATLMKVRFPEGVDVSDAREAVERTRNIWEKQNLVGLCLALVSLLTGGVGIMNIMLLSVSQRKKEIGLRKAIGASDTQILLQFLLEAIIVCFFGGVLGVGFGTLFGQQVAEMMGQWNAVVSPGTVLFALGFSLLTGVMFGLVPAMRASKLDPYEALRS